MDAEWVRWIVGTLVAALAGLAWYEVRRIGKNVHSLRTEVGALVLPIETDVRKLQLEFARIEGRQEEAEKWRTVVLAALKRRRRPRSSTT